MKKIIFVVPSLSGGGAERVIINLANNLDANEYDVIILSLLKNQSNDFKNRVKSHVDFVNLNCVKRIRYSAFPILKFINKIKPDIVFMGLGELNALMSLFIIKKNRIKWIARETNIPSKQNKNFIINLLYKTTYKKYFKIIAQSDDMYNDLIENFHFSKNKIVKINNPVDLQVIDNEIEKGTTFKKNEKKINFLLCGRITYQKGYDLLIEQLKDSTLNDNYHFYIIGNENKKNIENIGPLIRKKIKDFKLENVITICDFREDIFPIMEKIDFMLLSSRYEGFPNVAIESLCCGTPVIANNFCGGINEIIIDGENGYIFDIYKKGSFDEVLKKISNTVFDSNKIKKLAREKYSIESKITEFQSIFGIERN